MFKIWNFRDGFAANSSSTHSLVFTDDAFQYDDVSSDGFGWDQFVLASPDARNEYVAEVLYHHLKASCGKDVAITLTKLLTGVPHINGYYDYGGFNSYIDHQSMPVMPMDREGKGINIQFFKEYRDFMLQPKLVVCGGNDNNDEEKPVEGEHFNLRLWYDSGDTSVVARKDGDYWTLFSRAYGRKIRMSFVDDPGNTYAPEKASAPELVDVKITDFCDMGCPFCYQGSTTNGVHADYGYIYHLFNVLNEMEVFEVAIGGGEPTDHPKFVDILQAAKWKNLVVNFTTKKLNWLQDASKRQSILPLIGSFAYSANTEAEAREFIEVVTNVDMMGKKPSIQCVMGVVSRRDFKEMLVLCSKNRVQLTLLGYKAVGRGAETREKDYSWWIDEIKQARNEGNYCFIGVDTALIKKHRDIVEDEFPSYLYTEHEGKFSCYVDAVTKKLAPSSYAEMDQYVDFTKKDDAYRFKEIFAEF
jgi:MoaA/NifB/PqqE/SkfB family radical SAM enzyme